MPTALETALARAADDLRRFMARRAGWLLRHESDEDLAQGAALRALEAAPGFEWQGEDAFRAWLFRIARQHLAGRAGHWRTLKRDAGALLRISPGPLSGADPSGIDPTGHATGPVTFAQRREAMVLAMAALDTLPARDRELVRARLSGAPLAEVGERLGLGDAAAQRAQHRAMRRFELALRTLAGSARPRP